MVKLAKRNLPQTSWDYLIGGTETETTVARNRLSLDSLAFKPRVLNDVSTVDTTTSFLDQPMAMPILLAPVGSLQIFDPGGGATATKAAAEMGIMSIASSVCTPDIEEIAAASNASKVYQLYVRGDENWVDDIVRRVIDSGYKAFCLTVDTSVVSRRERDIAKGVSPTSPTTPGDMGYQASLNWQDVERIKQKFDIPLILKGINTAEDAAKAIDHGVDVIYVSNHGGRQLDHGRGAIDLLPEVVDIVGGRAEIAFDSGVCRGSDVVKAMALGADAVGIGRLEAWALAAGGLEGLICCLQLLQKEISGTLALMGIKNFSKLDASFVTAASPVTPPSVVSAFPLLNLEDPGY
jgi:glycolate oxidase